MNDHRGSGGTSCIDSVILRDRDTSAKWHLAADDKREERRYSCQNWRADVSAILTDAGSMVEWISHIHRRPYSLTGIWKALRWNPVT